ncbi:MAG: hypothetical protein O7J95_07420, partial [Planctomycetota bacterium]|nr:hypothetical protein [Planctomycetota bacterium]
MKARRCGIRGLGLIACCFCGPLGAQNTLDLGQGAGETGDVARVSLRLTTSDEVQGIVAVFQWDGARGTGADLVPAAALAEADTVVTRVENDFMVLGVVMDSNPADNGGIAEVVGPGQNILLATALITCSGADPLPTPVTFVDDTFAAAEGGPALDNVVVVGGLSIGNLEGLNLDDGEFTCAEQLDKLIIESG